jgi:fucose permease
MLLALAYLAFVSLGLPDGVLGVAWPSLRQTYGLRQDALGLASIALGTGYVLTSFFAGRGISLLGVGGLLAGSAGLAGLGLLLHASAPSWPAFAGAALLVGLGSGAVDAALNAVVARRYSARHVNWLHACYSAGATAGPILMSAALPAWRRGYAALGALLLVLAALFALARGRWGPAELSRPAGVRAVLRHPLARLQLVLFFVYTGLEATLGAWAYTVLLEARGRSASTSAAWTAAYFGGIAAGRVLFGMVVNRVGADRLVRGCAWAAAGGVALFALGVDAGVALAGLGLAPLFPCLMSLTPRRLGDVANEAIGMQVSAATVGAALAPAVGGLLARPLGPEAVALEALVLAGALALLCELSRGASPDTRP